MVSKKQKSPTIRELDERIEENKTKGFILFGLVLTLILWIFFVSPSIYILNASSEWKCEEPEIRTFSYKTGLSCLSFSVAVNEGTVCDYKDTESGCIAKCVEKVCKDNRYILTKVMENKRW